MEKKNECDKGLSTFTIYVNKKMHHKYIQLYLNIQT